MRLFVALALLSTLFVPLAAAEPFDCTGTGRPTQVNGTGLRCDRTTNHDGSTSAMRTAEVNGDNDFAGARLEFRHETRADEDSVRSSCRVSYHRTMGIGITSFNVFLPLCASHRVLA